MIVAIWKEDLKSVEMHNRHRSQSYALAHDGIMSLQLLCLHLRSTVEENHKL